MSVIVDEKWHDVWKLRFENPLNDAESMRINESGNITNLGQPVSNIDEIQGQFIGLMKFKNKGINDLKSYYDNAKKLFQVQILIISFICIHKYFPDYPF